MKRLATMLLTALTLAACGPEPTASPQDLDRLSRLTLGELARREDCIRRGTSTGTNTLADIRAARKLKKLRQAGRVAREARDLIEN